VTHKTLVSVLVWFVGWIGLFLIMEMLALFWKGCPWYTLSRTSWHTERAWWPFQFVFLFGLVILMVHIFEGGIIKLAVFAPKQAARRLKERL
jgi:hypothetical protein